MNLKNSKSQLVLVLIVGILVGGSVTALVVGDNSSNDKTGTAKSANATRSTTKQIVETYDSQQGKVITVKGFLLNADPSGKNIYLVGLDTSSKTALKLDFEANNVSASAYIPSESSKKAKNPVEIKGLVGRQGSTQQTVLIVQSIK